MDDKHLNKVVRSIFNKRAVDISNADVRISHGIVYIRGNVKFMKGSVPLDPEAAMAHVLRAVRAQPEVRDVIAEYNLL